MGYCAATPRTQRLLTEMHSNYSQKNRRLKTHEHLITFYRILTFDFVQNVLNKLVAEAGAFFIRLNL